MEVSGVAVHGTAGTMQPREDGGPREHLMENVGVPLHGPAPVVRVRRRQQWWRTYSALAAGVALAALIAVVLTTAGAGRGHGSPALAATETAEAPSARDMLKAAGAARDAGGALAPAHPPAAAQELTLRQMLKAQPNARCDRRTGVVLRVRGKGGWVPVGREISCSGHSNPTALLVRSVGSL